MERVSECHKILEDGLFTRKETNRIQCIQANKPWIYHLFSIVITKYPLSQINILILLFAFVNVSFST